MTETDVDNIAISVYRDIQTIRKTAPLVHNVTNFVVMQHTANALLALGASPIMAHAEEELADIVKIAQSLVINIGTLDSTWLSAMEKAMHLAASRHIPIILDPVGAGATEYRTQAVHRLLEAVAPTVIRGNASEILALASSVTKNTKGVDSTHQVEESVDAALSLAQSYNCQVIISGATDICLSVDKQLRGRNGTPMMTKITGMGCAASALTAAFCAVNSDIFAACCHAMTAVGIAGEMALEKAQGPGTLQIHFYDALYNLTEKDILEKIRVETIT